VLLGQHERHDTTQPPRSVSDARRHWITRYHNARSRRLPKQVEVLVREQHGHDQPGRLAHDTKPARRLDDAHERLQVERVAYLKLTEGNITVDQCREATVPHPLLRQKRWHRAGG